MLKYTLNILRFTLVTLKMIFTNTKAILKFFAIFFLLTYPFLNYSVADSITIFPALINGFILITPFIDYTFYRSRNNNYYQNFFDQGFKQQEIILAKTNVIFLILLSTIALNIGFIIFFNNMHITSLNYNPKHLKILFSILPALFSLILLEGIIQAYLGLIFLTRILNMTLFILNSLYMKEINNYLISCDINKLLISNTLSIFILLFLVPTFRKEWLHKKRKNNE